MIPPHEKDLDETQPWDTTNPHKHQSQQPIRRSMPVDDDWQMQTGNDMRERAVKVPLHLHRNPGPHGINSQTLPLQEQAQTFIQGTHNAPRNEQEHIPHTGEFHPSLHSPFIPFISMTCWQGLLYRQRYRYKNPLAKKIIPIFFHYITVALGLPLHKHIHRYYFLIRKNPEPFSYRHTSISRCHFMYTKIQSREILSHQKHC